jgi:hypothetical protein
MPDYRPVHTPLSRYHFLTTSTSAAPILKMTPPYHSRYEMSDQPGSSRFQDLFLSALQDYERVTNMSLAKHPLAEQLNSCHSVESITNFLQDQVRALGDLRGSDRLVKSIKNTVSTVYILSATTTLSDAVHLVCLIV